MLAQTRVQFVPFRWDDRHDKVLMSRDADRDWIVLSPTSGAIVAALDEGGTIEEVQGSLGPERDAPDVLAFVRELQDIGFVEAFGQGHRGSSRLVPRPSPRAGASWRILVLATAAAVGYVGWSLVSAAVAAPQGADLVLPGTGVGTALTVLLGVSLATAAVHELAHVRVARRLGLSPHVTMSGRELWSVVRTSLVGIWGLERRMQWRPVAAGLMADAVMLAAATAVCGLVDPTTTLAHVARLTTAVLAARMIWQAQWYLRTDVYFLFAVLNGAVNLRRTARLWLRAKLLGRTATGRNAASELHDEPASEVAAARMYCLSLPAAFLATAVLWGWFIIPFGRTVVERL
ncbi:MAG TPA: hypothetical protein VGO80_02225 [Solirubrobacteraceae bacterium]|jgi:hypothetical protein|nr:hypothetical protein [Solirubrobacteraceae bacterium]